MVKAGEGVANTAAATRRVAIIENPILNSPFEEPAHHFKFTEDGITDEIIDARRSSAYFIPIPRPKKKGKAQLQFDTEWTADRLQENGHVGLPRRRLSF